MRSFLPALPPLVLFSKNLGRLTISHGILTILACVVGFLLIMGLLRLVFRRPEITDALWAIVYSGVFMPVMFLNPDEYRIPWVLGWLVLGASLFLWNGARRLVPILATIFAVGNALPLLYNVFASGLWADRAEITSVVAAAFDADPVSAPSLRKNRTSTTLYSTGMPGRINSRLSMVTTIRSFSQPCVSGDFSSPTMPTPTTSAPRTRLFHR